MVFNEITLKPSIVEIERFVRFLDKKFNLKLPDKIVVNIDTNPIKGRKYLAYYSPPHKHNSWINKEGEAFAEISLFSFYLNKEPYISIAHETTHAYNNMNGVKDCTINQYHNKKFKEVAEKLLLHVEYIDYKGYCKTTSTSEFDNLLKEFEPNKKAFQLFQNLPEHKKQTTRMFKFSCSKNCFNVRCGNNNFEGHICKNCGGKYKKEVVD